MIPITGHTRWYALVADPISHVKAPTAFNDYFAAHDIDASVVGVHVSPDDLPAMLIAMRGWQNLVGIGVTIPHKETISRLVDELTPAAQLCGASNVIKRRNDGTLLGAQFDGSGFAVGLLKHGVDPRGARVLLAGAGGSARAIAFELARRGAAGVDIVNRTAAKAESLAAEVRAAFDDVTATAAGRDVRGYDLIVNSTKLGMQPHDALPFDLESLSSEQVVADVVMQPAVTPLLERAAELGCHTVPGRAMLDGQIEVTVEFLELEPAPATQDAR